MGRWRGQKWWESEQGLKEKEGGRMREKGCEERARKHSRKTLILIPLWFRCSLVAFQETLKPFPLFLTAPDTGSVPLGVSGPFLRGYRMSKKVSPGVSGTREWYALGTFWFGSGSAKAESWLCLRKLKNAWVSLLPFCLLLELPKR